MCATLGSQWHHHSIWQHTASVPDVKVLSMSVVRSEQHAEAMRRCSRYRETSGRPSSASWSPVLAVQHNVNPHSRCVSGIHTACCIAQAGGPGMTRREHAGLCPPGLVHWWLQSSYCQLQPTKHRVRRVGQCCARALSMLGFVQAVYTHPSRYPT